jgi:hypothetical protein
LIICGRIQIIVFFQKQGRILDDHGRQVGPTARDRVRCCSSPASQVDGLRIQLPLFPQLATAQLPLLPWQEDKQQGKGQWGRYVSTILFVNFEVLYLKNSKIRNFTFFNDYLLS